MAVWEQTEPYWVVPVGGHLGSSGLLPQTWPREPLHIPMYTPALLEGTHQTWKLGDTESMFGFPVSCSPLSGAMGLIYIPATGQGPIPTSALPWVVGAQILQSPGVRIPSWH